MGSHFSSKTDKMKVILALCFLGAASAAVIPLTYTSGIVPQAAGYIPYNSPGIIPYTGGAFPTVYTGTPIVSTYQVAAINPVGGYVAKTLGNEHWAPLPAGSANFASHHINMAKAPGTK